MGKKDNDYGLLISGVISIIIIIGSWLLAYFYLKDLEETDRGTLGDMFGTVNSLYSGLALAGIIFTILLQRKELSLQRDELKATRKEFNIQNETLRLQRFETTFFNSINLLLSVTNSSIYQQTTTKRDGTREREIFEGREALSEVYESYFKSIYETNNENHKLKTHLNNQNMDENVSLNQLIEISFSELYDGHEHILGHYFRTLYNIIIFVDQGKVGDPKYYINIISSQLSTFELLLLFYYCLSSKSDVKFKNLAIKYSLFNNISYNNLLELRHKELYPEHAFQ